MKTDGRIRTIALASASLAITACHPTHRSDTVSRATASGRAIQVADPLDCPDKVARLTRVSRAADGRACGYTGPGGLDIALSLNDLAGRTPDTYLSPLETALRADVGGVVPPGSATPEAARQGDGDHAKIDLPGLHIDADASGASIHLPGMSLDASDSGANIHTGSGGRNAVVRAFDGGAEIHSRNGGANTIDASYLVSSDRGGPAGYRVAGYRAKGPSSGPLLIAVFKGRGEHGAHTDHAVNELMALNTRAPG